ncbi:MAG: cobalamin-dependent protein [Chloroflexi bacterium]|nr:cobalamin-dependent protein [Chloroflexota bacterium]
MRTLLVATNRAERYMDRMVVRPLPIGLAYLAASIDERRHPFEVLDLMFSRNALADVEAAVRQFRPEVVGLSIRNLDNQSALNPQWHLPAVREIVRRLRSISSARIVCGGPAFSILPAECLGYLEADLGLVGDAAASFAALLDRLDSGADFSDVPGLICREADRVMQSPPELSADFRKQPRLDLLDIRRYHKAGFGVGVVTKLAQSYYASANTPDRFDGHDWRIRPVDDVLEEVRGLTATYGIRKVFFIDSGFNIQPEHAKALCRALISSSQRLRWNSYLRSGECDDELVELMKRSGCSLVLLTGTGNEYSSAQEQVAALDGLRNLTSVCHRAGLPFALTIAFGGIGEDEATVEQKLAFLRQVEPRFAALRVGIRVLPNTPTARAALEEKLISSESELITPTFYTADGVKTWLAERLRAEAAGQPRWNLS